MLVVLGCAGTARADSVVTFGEEPPRNYTNLRIGAATSDPEGHPSLCLEASPLSFLSLEGCGTGSGMLHHSTASELAHFRTKWRLARVKTGRGWFLPHLGVGFAELQVGDDDPGFDFEGSGREGRETAGGEAGLGLKYLVAMPRGTEFIAEAGVSAAYLPHAPDLARPADPWQVTASFTAGFGF